MKYSELSSKAVAYWSGDKHGSHKILRVGPFFALYYNFCGRIFLQSFAVPSV